MFLADKGFDSDDVRADIESRSAYPVIPFRKGRKDPPPIDDFIYALRNQVERCIGRLKQSRRFATRYDPTSSSFIGFALIGSIRLWIRHFVHTA